MTGGASPSEHIAAAAHPPLCSCCFSGRDAWNVEGLAAANIEPTPTESRKDAANFEPTATSSTERSANSSLQSGVARFEATPNQGVAVQPNHTGPQIGAPLQFTGVPPVASAPTFVSPVVVVGFQPISQPVSYAAVFQPAPGYQTPIAQVASTTQVFTSEKVALHAVGVNHSTTGSAPSISATSGVLLKETSSSHASIVSSALINAVTPSANSLSTTSSPERTVNQRATTSQTSYNQTVNTNGSATVAKETSPSAPSQSLNVYGSSTITAISTTASLTASVAPRQEKVASSEMQQGASQETARIVSRSIQNVSDSLSILAEKAPAFTPIAVQSAFLGSVVAKSDPQAIPVVLKIVPQTLGEITKSLQSISESIAPRTNPGVVAAQSVSTPQPTQYRSFEVATPSQPATQIYSNSQQFSYSSGNGGASSSYQRVETTPTQSPPPQHSIFSASSQQSASSAQHASLHRSVSYNATTDRQQPAVRGENTVPYRSNPTSAQQVAPSATQGARTQTSTGQAGVQRSPDTGRISTVEASRSVNTTQLNRSSSAASGSIVGPQSSPLSMQTTRAHQAAANPSSSTQASVVARDGSLASNPNSLKAPRETVAQRELSSVLQRQATTTVVNRTVTNDPRLSQILFQQQLTSNQKTKRKRSTISESDLSPSELSIVHELIAVLSSDTEASSEETAIHLEEIVRKLRALKSGDATGFSSSTAETQSGVGEGISSETSEETETLTEVAPTKTLDIYTAKSE